MFLFFKRKSCPIECFQLILNRTEIYATLSRVILCNRSTIYCRTYILFIYCTMTQVSKSRFSVTNNVCARRLFSGLSWNIKIWYPTDRDRATLLTTRTKINSTTELVMNSFWLTLITILGTPFSYWSIRKPGVTNNWDERIARVLA